MVHFKAVCCFNFECLNSCWPCRFVVDQPTKSINIHENPQNVWICIWFCRGVMGVVGVVGVMGGLQEIAKEDAAEVKQMGQKWWLWDSFHIQHNGIPYSIHCKEYIQTGGFGRWLNRNCHSNPPGGHFWGDCWVNGCFAVCLGGGFWKQLKQHGFGMLKLVNCLKQRSSGPWFEPMNGYRRCKKVMTK